MSLTFPRMLRAFPVIVILLFPFLASGRGQGPTSIPSAVTTLATKYLRSIHDTNSYDSPDGRHEDFIFVGTSIPPSNGWRIIVVRDRGNERPRLIWDSFTLSGPYFDVMGSSDVDDEADGPSGYVITLRGCAPHDCSDGRIGFALYASRTGRTYVSHVTTRFDNSYDVASYDVTYDPKSGMPDAYRAQLNRMMCADNGISHRSKLPITCAAK